MLSSADHHHKMAESIHAWWREAGVDYACDGDVMNWLAPPDVALEPEKPVRELVQKSAIPAIVAALPKAKAEWPQDLAALKAAIASGVALPGCGYGSRSVPPTGKEGATAFVLVDCPEEEEVAAGRFGEGKSAVLLKNMLLAAQVLPDFTYQTALASSRSAVVTIPKSDLAELAAFVQHQIALVKPQIVILFGTAACEALLGQDVMQARGNLQYFNQDDRKTAAIATFHPRTLIAQPQLKAKAWQDLQMLARKDYL